MYKLQFRGHFKVVLILFRATFLWQQVELWYFIFFAVIKCLIHKFNYDHLYTSVTFNFIFGFHYNEIFRKVDLSRHSNLVRVQLEKFDFYYYCCRLNVDFVICCDWFRFVFLLTFEYINYLHFKSNWTCAWLFDAHINKNTLLALRILLKNLSSKNWELWFIFVIISVQIYLEL